MREQVQRFVQGCQVCACIEDSTSLIFWETFTSTNSQRPWSHLGIDFITDLPPSGGNTCILIIVDRFSKACKLIPLPGLPTALVTAESLFNQVFRHFGIPEDIVSDRGPQFISRVLESFLFSSRSYDKFNIGGTILRLMDKLRERFKR